MKPYHHHPPPHKVQREGLVINTNRIYFHIRISNQYNSHFWVQTLNLIFILRMMLLKKGCIRYQVEYCFLLNLLHGNEYFLSFLNKLRQAGGDSKYLRARQKTTIENSIMIFSVFSRLLFLFGSFLLCFNLIIQ